MADDSRRSFFRKAAGVVAAAAAIPLTRLEPRADGPILLPDDPGTPDHEPDAAARSYRVAETSIGTVYTPTGTVEDAYAEFKAKRQLYNLQKARGLVKPCPDCRIVEWKQGSPGMIQCARCGWIAKAGSFVAPCECADCTGRPAASSWWGKVDELPAMDPHELETAAPGTLARLLTPISRQYVKRTEKNVYEIERDDWIHNVEQMKLARVICGVRARLRPDLVLNPAAHDRIERANGDLIVYAWHTVNCTEWRERGITT